MSLDAQHVMFAVQILFSTVGLVLLWKTTLAPSVRRQAAVSPLPALDLIAPEFLWFILLILLGTFVFALLANALFRPMGLSSDAAMIVSGAAGQFGMLAGVLTFAARSPAFRQQTRVALPKVIKSGVVTFLISLPILVATSQAWELLLQAFGLPAEKQDLIRLFADTKAMVPLTALTLLATVVAPLTEELIFRAGVFRYFRTRTPRFVALWLPAVIFASLHVNWSTLEGFASFLPLLVLAVIFSIAYERTGNIGTPIVAHALFNLNTVLMILTGLAR